MASGHGKDNTSTGEPDRAKMMRVLIPALAVGAIVLLVAVITGMSDGLGTKMSDGSNGEIDDSDLKELEPGVKYRDLKEGIGEACKPGATVKMKYKGWLHDGTVFDGNLDKNAGSVEFELNNLIKGWQAGIPGMKPGGVRKLVISADKGYGAQGSPPKIPGGSTLIFEVELVSIVPKVSTTEGAGKPMSDDSDGGTNDAALKDIGDGLKIRDLKEGSGEPVRPLASVTVHYTGWLPNGTVFDSSKGKEPVTFSLNEVVKGWGKGIPGMKPGGIRKIVIPPELGYGSKGQGKIPGNSTLIFEVELIK